DQAIPFIHDSAPPGAPSVFEDVNGITDINELFAFTPAYLHGGVIGPAYRPTGEWIATITADFLAVGTVRVRTADGVDPYVSQWDGDAELGGRLADATGVDIVEDEPTGAFYAVFGETIGPLNFAAETVLPTPTTLAEFQQILVARLATGDAAEAPDPPEPGSILAIVGVVLAVVAGTAVLISARVRGRRSARGSSPAG
ncbi:MAG: hypothetical protein ABL886_16185, partial [Rhodoglobus sp.]